MGLFFEIIGLLSDVLGLSYREQFPRFRTRRALKRAVARSAAKALAATGDSADLPHLRGLLAGLDEEEFVDAYGNLVLRDSLVRRIGASDRFAAPGADPAPLIRELSEALLDQVRRMGGSGGVLLQLHSRVQDARNALFDPAALPAVDFTGTAFALPKSDEPIIGREDDIADLLDHCRDAGGATIVWIHGEAGSGKTTLAAEFARRLDERGGGAVPFVRMRGASRQLGGGAYRGTDANRLLADLLHSYDVLGADRLPEAELRARWKAVVRQRNVQAVVLDDVRDVGQVEPFLPGDAHCVLIVSSREYRPGLAARRCPIPALPTEVVLRHLVGFEQEDSELVSGLIRGISAVPLMLPLVRTIGGGRQQGLGALLDKVRGTDFVGAAHQLVIDRLDPSLRRTLGLLAGQPGFRLTADGLAALDAIGEDEAATRLEQLAEQGLLKPGTGDSYAFHDRTYAAVEADLDDYVPPAELDAARSRLLRRRLEWARAVNACYDDGQGRPAQAGGLRLTPEQSHHWLTFERRNLREALRFHRDLGAAEDLAVLTELALLIGAPLLRIGFTRDAELFLTAAVELAAGQDDVLGEAEARRALGGRVFRMLDRYAEAERELTRACELYIDLGDAEGQAGSYNGLGHIARLRGDWDTAEGHLRRARKRYAELGLDRGEADCLLGLGEIATLRPDPDLERAFDLYRQAGRLFQDHYDMRGVAESCWGRAEVARLRGDLEAATRLYDTALDLARSNHDQLVEADARRGKGDLAAAEGDDDAALEHFATAVELYRRILDQVGTADALAGQGETLLRLGRREEAAKAIEEAAELYSGIGHRRAGQLRRLLREQGLTEPAPARRRLFRRKERSAAPA